MGYYCGWHGFADEIVNESECRDLSTFASVNASWRILTGSQASQDPGLLHPRWSQK
jgi:hypothetical protein